MDELIRKQDALDALKKAYWDANLQSAKDDPCVIDAMTDWAIRQIKALPPVQPKHGKWIRDFPVYYCSECKKHAHIDYNKWDVFSPGVSILSDFCPHCGADMRCSENPNS